MQFSIRSLPKSVPALVLGIFAFAMIGCDSGDDSDTRESITTVGISSTTGSEMLGTVTIMTSSQNENLLTITGSLAGLSQGDHGMHLHTNPDCAAADIDGDGEDEPAGAAGPHYDRGDSGHGAPNDDPGERHYGDFGNITITSSGDSTRFEKVVERPEGFVFNGVTYQDLSGRAVVIHENADDLQTDPGGNSGTRVGCGAIVGQ